MPMDQGRIPRLLAVAVVLAALSTALWASAALARDDYPADCAPVEGENCRTAPLDAYLDRWGFYSRECTSFVAWRLSRSGPFHNAMKGGKFGHAWNWGRNAPDVGFPVNSKPALGAVAWHDRGAGHVAIVVAINKKQDKVTVEDYNRDFQGNYDRHTEPRSTYRYIHIYDGVSPVGNLDHVEGLSGNRVRVTGWALDPDRAAEPVRVEVWIDGKRGQRGARRVSLGYAKLSRSDVARARPGAGARHGFRSIITGVSPGKHAVRVYALNRFKAGGVTYLGGKTVRVPLPPADEPEPDDPLDEEPTAPVFQQFNYGWASGDHFQSFMGDFNGDNQVDVGLRRTTDGTFYWRPGPNFNSQYSYGWAAGTGPGYQSFMGDFNGDNQADIGLRRISDGRFYWRPGPNFDSQYNYGWATGAGPEYVSFTGDFNGDQLVDLGLRRVTDGRFYWRLQLP